jgi:lipopolysaccharide export system protein LptC
LSVAQIDERGRRGYTVTGRADNERMFRAAVRHSRFVRVLRVGIPSVVVAGIALSIVVTTWLDPLLVLAKFPFNISGVVVTSTSITMQKPRFEGYTKDERAYRLTARAAIQVIAKPDDLELEEIKSR